MILSQGWEEIVLGNDIGLTCRNQGGSNFNTRSNIVYGTLYFLFESNFSSVKPDYSHISLSEYILKQSLLFPNSIRYHERNVQLSRSHY